MDRFGLVDCTRSEGGQAPRHGRRSAQTRRGNAGSIDGGLARNRTLSSGIVECYPTAIRDALLTVVMPVYNAMPYLAEAIESILAQSYGDFVFIIADDGSTDGSLECMRGFAARDPRIRVIKNEKRLGPSRSSNGVANAATTPFVARMDADDLSHPERLAKQMAVMLAHPEACMVGSLFNVVDRNAKMLIRRGLWRLLVKQLPPIAHSSILYRREHFDAAGGYSDECRLL